MSSQELIRLKESSGLSVGVCLPALNEAETIGPICSTIKETVMQQGIVDRLVVVDSGSSDHTRDIAVAAGADVFDTGSLVPQVPQVADGGKGDALWRSLAVVDNDIIVWLDSDTQNLTDVFVSELIRPLLEDPSIQFVKGFYERPLGAGDPSGGGRVTELVARPLINLLYPELSHIVQPLSGEYAGRREALLSVPFLTGYAVEIGLLLHLAETFGVATIAQADLGTRIHRTRGTQALGRMAFQITSAFLEELSELGRIKLLDELPDSLRQFEGAHPTKHRLPVTRRPPMAEVLGSGYEI